MLHSISFVLAQNSLKSGSWLFESSMTLALNWTRIEEDPLAGMFRAARALPARWWLSRRASSEVCEYSEIVSSSCRSSQHSETASWEISLFQGPCRLAAIFWQSYSCSSAKTLSVIGNMVGAEGNRPWYTLWDKRSIRRAFFGKQIDSHRIGLSSSNNP